MWQVNLSYCSVTDVGLLSVTGIKRLRNMTILHLSGLTPNGLAAALLTSGSLTKVKLHRSFRPLLPEHIFKYMEARGCVFHWRDKAFQVYISYLHPTCHIVNRFIQHQLYAKRRKKIYGCFSGGDRSQRKAVAIGKATWRKLRPHVCIENFIVPCHF